MPFESISRHCLLHNASNSIKLNNKDGVEGSMGHHRWGRHRDVSHTQSQIVHLHLIHAPSNSGTSIARRFAQRYAVALIARNKSSYEAIVDEINSSGGKAVGFTTDMSHAASVKDTFEAINDAMAGNKLAAAVYNVGGGLVRKPFVELSAEEIEGGWISNGYAVSTPCCAIKLWLIMLQFIGADLPISHRPSYHFCSHKRKHRQHTLRRSSSHQQPQHSEPTLSVPPLQVASSLYVRSRNRWPKSWDRKVYMLLMLLLMA